MKSIAPNRASVLRLVIISLLSFASAVALLAFAVSASRKASNTSTNRTNLSLLNTATKSDDAQNPNAPLSPVIVATLTDNITAATKVAPGGTINYTAVITNNGAASPADDATNLNFSAPLDANTTLVGGSIHASPIAFNDTYNWVGNTQLDTVARVLPAVTANDVAVNAPAGTDTFTVTAIGGGATALGGVVTLASPTGSFVYTPPLGRPNIADGATVQDSFTYMITNSADPTLTSTGTVRINLTGRVWYLVAGGVGDGRSGTPSGSPSAMSTAADKSTDIFYIFSNASSLNGLFTVDAGQQLLGQGVNLVVNAITLFNSGAAPTTTNTAGSCVALAGAPGNNTLSGFNIGNCTGGTAITGANVGTLNVSTLSINTNGGALDLTGVGAPTVSVVLGGTSSTGGAKNVNLIGLNGTFTLASGALSGATGNGFDVNGGTATITYSGAISNSGSRQVNISNKTGGSVTFDGAVSGTGTGINLATNTGATITFRGGVVLSTGASTAFGATGGGTVNVCDENPCVPGSTGALVNTLTTTTATALNVNATTIGANKLEFRSISAGTAAAGPAKGISLNNTGTGGLTVTGTGSTDGSGGTIQDAAAGTTMQRGIEIISSQNISLSNMTLTNACRASGAVANGVFGNNTSVNGALYLQSVTSVSLTNVDINGSVQHGINGNNVTNFDLSNSIIQNTGNEVWESGIFIENLKGTSAASTDSTISNCTIQHTGQFNLFVQNNSATNAPGGNTTYAAVPRTTMDQLTLSSDQFLDSGVNLFGDNVTIVSNNGGNMRTVVTGSTFDGTVGGGFGTSDNIQVDASGSGHADTDIGTSSFSDGGQSAINISGAGTGFHTFDVHNNPTVTVRAGVGINVAGNGDAEMRGFVRNNPVIYSTVSNNPGSGIQVFSELTGLTVTTLDNNVIQTQPGTPINGFSIGIRAYARQTGELDLTVTNNTVNVANNPGVNGFEGITVDAGNAAPGENNTVKLNLSNNSIDGVNSLDYFFTQYSPNTFQIQGLTPASGGTAAQVQAYIATKDTDPSPTDPTVDVQGGLVVNYTAGNPATAGIRGLNGGGASPSTFARQKQHPVFSFASFLEKFNRAPQSLDAHALTGSGDDISPSTIPYTVNQHVAAIGKPGAANASPSHRAALGNVMHHAINTMANVAHTLDSLITPTAYAQEPSAPTSGENVTLNAIATFPAAGKAITIKYSATVNTPPLARQVSTQGTVTATGGISVLTDDPEPAGSANPTVTLVDTLMTWNGSTNTDWNTASNWIQPAGGTQYAPGVSNPAVNDVVIPNVGAQPNISATDIGVFSLNISNGRTLTITNPRILTIGGSPGGDLTLDGIISGGELRLGTGTHVINNAGGTGSLSATNVATVLSGSAVTLNNNLQAGALAVNSGGNMNIASRTLSLNAPGAAFTSSGVMVVDSSTVVVFNGSTGAQTAAGITYPSLTINNPAGVTLTGNATVTVLLTLTSGDLDTGANTLTMLAAATSGPATNATDVVGNVLRTGFVSGGSALSFGNPFNTIRINSGTVPAGGINVLIAKNAPTSYPSAVQRSYTITPLGGSGITATVRLHYLDTELNGNTPEANLNLRRFNGTGWAPVIPTASNTGDATNNWLESNAVTAFSEWTFSTFTPTASNGVVTGRIVDSNGSPVEGAVVRLSGTQNRKFITDANGFYRFENVETNGFYTVTPSRANYEFNPAVRSFSQLGETTEATFGATLASSSNFLNPLDTPEYFVRQHYLDFLGREPDESGFNFWSDQILECGTDTQCIERRRENVSAAYFLSIEFQKTGGLVDGLYRATYGVRPNFAEFMPDTRAVAQGVVVGQEGWEAKLQANKEAFVAAFANRPAFHAVFDSMDNSLFVDTLISHTGVTFTDAERDALVGGLTAGTSTRADVLRNIAENQRFINAKFNDAFVMMEYFGYLRRDADASGFAFWLNKLNEFGGNFEQAEMVKAFIVSSEYRGRFPR